MNYELPSTKHQARTLSIGFSPCPNDTFIFDALIHKKIDTEYLEFNSFIADIEVLNKRALNYELDITKISFPTYFKVKDKYTLLQSGSALGYDCGPLLIAKKSIPKQDYNNIKVAIPGLNTTANLLLSISYPEIKNKVVMLFSDIEDAVLNGVVDAGLIIHESRFTYMNKGLVKLCDVGESWYKQTGCAVPLGCIVASKSLPTELIKTIESLINKSIKFAYKYPKSGKAFIKANAQELSDDVINKHIALYVNEYSLNLGEVGMKAINKLENMKM